MARGSVMRTRSGPRRSQGDQALANPHHKNCICICGALFMLENLWLRGCDTLQRAFLVSGSSREGTSLASGGLDWHAHIVRVFDRILGTDPRIFRISKSTVLFDRTVQRKAQGAVSAPGWGPSAVAPIGAD